MEAGLALLDLILVVDHLKDARAQLGAHLAKHSVGLQTLDHEVL